MKHSRAAVHRKVHKLPALRFEQQTLTSYGGLVLLQALVSRLQLKDRLRACFSHLNVAPIFGHHLVVLLLVVTVDDHQKTQNSRRTRKSGVIVAALYRGGASDATAGFARKWPHGSAEQAQEPTITHRRPFACRHPGDPRSRERAASSRSRFPRVYMSRNMHLFLGYRELREARYYGDDPLLRRLLGLTRLPDVATICRALGQADARSVAKVGALSRQLGRDRLQQLGRPRLPLDCVSVR